MKIYMDRLHDKESIHNDPREAVTKSNFTPGFQRSQQKDALDIKICLTTLLSPPQFSYLLTILHGEQCQPSFHIPNKLLCSDFLSYV